MSRSSNTHTIACGTCNVAAQCIANPKADDQVTCPRCDRRDRYEDVIRIVKEHVVYALQKKLNDSLSRSTRGNRYVKFTAKPIGHRSFGWVALGV